MIQISKMINRCRQKIVLKIREIVKPEITLQLELKEMQSKSKLVKF